MVSPGLVAITQFIDEKDVVQWAVYLVMLCDTETTRYHKQTTGQG